MLPTFLVIGAVKAGTTAMHAYLRTHPDVFMPQVKELSFFHGANWERGLGWYERWFADAGDATAIGEASPGYTRHPVIAGVPERIASVIPDVRLVYVIRHPIDRLLSQYRHGVLEGAIRGRLDALVRDPDSGIVAASCYARQIDRYLAHFDRRQLLVVTSEDLRADRVATLGRVFRFLEVDEHWVPPNLGAEPNLGSALRAASPVTARGRRSPVYQTLKHRVPVSVRRRLWRAVTRPGDLDPAALELSPDAREALLAILEPDLRRLREHLEPGFGCWGLLDR